MDGVWIAPVTAQVMMTLLLDAMAYFRSVDPDLALTVRAPLFDISQGLLRSSWVLVPRRDLVFSASEADRPGTANESRTDDRHFGHFVLRHGPQMARDDLRAPRRCRRPPAIGRKCCGRPATKDRP